MFQVLLPDCAGPRSNVLHTRHRDLVCGIKGSLEKLLEQTLPSFPPILLATRGSELVSLWHVPNGNGRFYWLPYEGGSTLGASATAGNSGLSGAVSSLNTCVARHFRSLDASILSQVTVSRTKARDTAEFCTVMSLRLLVQRYAAEIDTSTASQSTTAPQ